MTREMQKQQRRANRILRQFGRYVNEEAADEAAIRETPTIARTKPRAFARIKRGVAWRLMAKGEVDK